MRRPSLQAATSAAHGRLTVLYRAQHDAGLVASTKSDTRLVDTDDTRCTRSNHLDPCAAHKPDFGQPPGITVIGGDPLNGPRLASFKRRKVAFCHILAHLDVTQPRV